MGLDSGCVIGERGVRMDEEGEADADRVLVAVCPSAAV